MELWIFRSASRSSRDVHDTDTDQPRRAPLIIPPFKSRSVRSRHAGRPSCCNASNQHENHGLPRDASGSISACFSSCPLLHQSSVAVLVACISLLHHLRVQPNLNIQDTLHIFVNLSPCSDSIRARLTEQDHYAPTVALQQYLKTMLASTRAVIASSSVCSHADQFRRGHLSRTHSLLISNSINLFTPYQDHSYIYHNVLIQYLAHVQSSLPPPLALAFSKTKSTFCKRPISVLRLHNRLDTQLIVTYFLSSAFFLLTAYRLSLQGSTLALQLASTSFTTSLRVLHSLQAHR